MKKDIKQNEIWGSSLRIFPWDKKDSITEVESLISNTLLEWYKKKHRSSSLKELQLLNSLEKTHAPYCGSAQFIKKDSIETVYNAIVARTVQNIFHP